MSPRFHVASLVVIALALCVSSPFLSGYGKQLPVADGCSSPTAAQDKNKITVTGTVQDPQGAVVAGARVVVELVKCKCSDCSPPEPCKCCPNQVNSTTDNAGNFSFTVPHGTYTVSVELRGLKKKTTLDLNEGTSTSTSITVNF
jgi:hypothetical protein